MTTDDANALRRSSTLRPTSWWLDALKKRATRIHEYEPAPEGELRWQSEAERLAALRFFNAAFRAEESGLRQAHELADEVRVWDPDLAQVLELYGNEEGWHRELLTKFLTRLGGEVRPMGRVTSLFYRLYARAKRMETIVITNLMFETIGATTYRLALGRVQNPEAQEMLTILTRDESFHVPLNVHFLRNVLARNTGAHTHLRRVFYLLYASLALLPLASRPKAQAFDRIGRWELMRAYVRELARVFLNEPDLGLEPPRLLLFLFGLKKTELLRTPGALSSVHLDAAVDRDRVQVTAL